MTRTITITLDQPSGWEVLEGDRTTGPLSWDEMLGQVAAMTLPVRHHSASEGLYGMRTPDEWEAHHRHQRRHWVPHSGNLGRMCIESLEEFVRELGQRGGEADELRPWHQQDNPRVRLAMMLLDACRENDANVVDAEVKAP